MAPICAIKVKYHLESQSLHATETFVAHQFLRLLFFFNASTLETAMVGDIMSSRPSNSHQRDRSRTPGRAFFIFGINFLLD